MAEGKKWVLVKAFDGQPKRTDLEIREFDIPEVKDGEVLLETVVLSVDPYQRIMNKVGEAMPAEVIAKVVQSENPKVKAGDYVVANVGWVTHAVIPGENALLMPPIPKGVPISLGLSTLGMPGLTAYLGLFEVCSLKPTDTVYVNAAAGAVGTVVGQIAKIKGAKVIGSAGSDEKVEYLKNLGFDEAYNYKKVTPDKLKEELNKLAPNGIDIFFEMVGGEASSVIYSHMNKNGRVGVFGSIANYNRQPPKVTEVTLHQNVKTLRIQGFIVFEHYDKRDEPLKQLAQWVKEVANMGGNVNTSGVTAARVHLLIQKWSFGRDQRRYAVYSAPNRGFSQGKIKYKENVYTGFDSMFDAFVELFTSKNLGKSVVKV